MNLTGCETEETGQARIRYQFGIWDASIRYWEFCDISNIILNLQNTNELLSIGYKTLGVHDRHIDNGNEFIIFVVFIDTVQNICYR